MYSPVSSAAADEICGTRPKNNRRSLSRRAGILLRYASLLMNGLTE